MSDDEEAVKKALEEYRAKLAREAEQRQVQKALADKAAKDAENRAKRNKK